MDILTNVISGFIVEVGKFVCKCINPDVENTVHFSSNWIEDVRELENEWESMQENIAAAKRLTYRCCPNCSLRSEVWTQAQNSIQVKLCSLKNGGESFGSNLMEENYRMEKVEHLPGPSIKNQSAARKNLDKILQHLENDEVGIIGVWGAGGIGKTTLVKNLNNELKQIDMSIWSKLSFGVVIWITVPKPPIDIRKVQAQIANRLNIKVDTEGSEESNASKIYQWLKQEKSFLVILEDVWEAIDLDYVGVPQPKDHAGSNVIITSRFLDVCNQMKIDTEMKVYTLDENESWALFIKTVGDVANWKDIEPLAIEIARECDGLPLAITVIGASMRGKNMAEQWKDALESLRKSEPNATYVRDKVYKVIKWSNDSLEQRGNGIQSCFLYCSLYPVSIPTNDLIHCWWAEGFLGEHDTYEKAYNRGITIIEELKNVCLLEEVHDMDCVKMHDVVRDVAKWIDNTFGDEHSSVTQAGIELIKISNVEVVSASVKRLSFITQGIQYLPDNFTDCPKTTSLLLQGNESLLKIPNKFFLSFPVLRVLNLSYTC
ncbi:hypothetical protein H5410_039462 [Solanum commersonii]|uniref:NB-ARC domain-containing protein n=1 Tax=Solanum commersonii TaxID=4109 RepID=A0A9J5XNN4_SOLCO|nr:hypothetical protein H5410_039462 [Solanum commersonii]